MTKPKPPGLSRRERQIMDILYRLGEASAAEVQEQLPDPPSYSAVRALLKILEDKDHVTHEQRGPRYVFSPVVPRRKARESALRQLLGTFFDGSTGKAVSALLDLSAEDMSEAELDELADLIQKAREDGR